MILSPSTLAISGNGIFSRIFQFPESGCCTPQIPPDGTQQLLRNVLNGLKITTAVSDRASVGDLTVYC
jgi:hypothetical protein